MIWSFLFGHLNINNLSFKKEEKINTKYYPFYKYNSKQVWVPKQVMKGFSYIEPIGRNRSVVMTRYYPVTKYDLELKSEYYLDHYETITNTEYGYQLSDTNSPNKTIFIKGGLAHAISFYLDENINKPIKIFLFSGYSICIQFKNKKVFGYKNIILSILSKVSIISLLSLIPISLKFIFNLCKDNPSEKDLTRMVGVVILCYISFHTEYILS